jgi:hypothetical protein
MPATTTASLGTSQPGFFAGLYRFTPRPSGLVNRDPTHISPGTTYPWTFSGAAVTYVR